MKTSSVKRALQVFLIVGIAALMAGTAFGQNRRHHGGDSHSSNDGRQWRTYTGGTNWSGGRRMQHRRARIQRQRTRTPVSGVPEPSAALLFATGGLIVAHTIRKKNKTS